ncbi:hypothetical protein ACHWQZ_G002977 [Mnemiopsis leidyi]
MDSNNQPDIPIEGKVRFLKTTTTQKNKILQRFSINGADGTSRVISYFPDTETEYLTNGDLIEGVCSVSGKYTTLVVFEKKSKTTRKTTSSSGKVRKISTVQTQGLGVGRGKRLHLDDCSASSQSATDLQTLLDLNFNE